LRIHHALHQDTAMNSTHAVTPKEPYSTHDFRETSDSECACTVSCSMEKATMQCRKFHAYREAAGFHPAVTLHNLSRHTCLVRMRLSVPAKVKDARKGILCKQHDLKLVQLLKKRPQHSLFPLLSLHPLCKPSLGSAYGHQSHHPEPRRQLATCRRIEAGQR